MSTTVLIIDDDLASLNSIDGILQQQNFNTYRASDGSMGLELAHEVSPDLILSDTRLPKRDGFSVLAELRESEATSTIPFILLSEKAEFKDFYKGLELGADHYLMKPLTSESLLSAIATCLERYERLEKRALMQQQRIQSLEQKLRQQQELSTVQATLLHKFVQEMRHPISNISLLIQMIPEDAIAPSQKQEFSWLEDECFRVIALLNEVSNCQELLLSSRIGVLQRLLMPERSLLARCS